ncbi:MAG: CDP-alcohol phosphatidyltransferase family protein [Holosporaceae bacterium]|nr:CDP-alcohol phosphatidyltransferase family protein [Holosporaceae bacterium]
MKYVPNVLSLSRIALSFLLIPMFQKQKFGNAFLIFSLAAISDFFDGYLARKFQATSRLGALLDPLADKILMATAYILSSHFQLINFYVTVLVVGRDILILSIFALCFVCRITLDISPLWSSKVNTTIQLLFLLLILSCNWLSVRVPFIAGFGAAIVSIFTVYSGAEYARKYLWIKDKIFKR